MPRGAAGSLDLESVGSQAQNGQIVDHNRTGGSPDGGDPLQVAHDPGLGIGAHRRQALQLHLALFALESLLLLGGQGAWGKWSRVDRAGLHGQGPGPGSHQEQNKAMPS